ncbi:myb-binding protein 1A-like protein [Huso huso]|uniref:Myb-binding protein 1A-like protein n=1 Tax=Huso huso TaxID=61971 RepID=A0ABR0YSS3_HUSHU
MVCARSPRSMAGGESNMGEIETEPIRPKVTDAKGILKQNREFLDFFWDIAKPEQEIRLQAIENLVQYLKNSEKEDELRYTLKRLVEGLAATRETARPGFSLALAQVLQVFEDVPLQSVLDQIKEKHDPQKVKKKLVRNAAFGNFFGVLSLSQSGRLTKEPRVVLESVQLLQSLAQFREHLKDLPRKTMVDILSETPEAVFEEVLLGALKSDLSSAFSTPEQLHLLLVAIQRFPGVLKPKKLKNLLGASSVVTADNIPKLVEVLKTAAKSVKKDRTMPPVGLDLLKVALKENSFDLFWKEAVINGLLKDQLGPSSYMCYRLLGSALPLLSFNQLKCVLGGEVMKHYGEHVVTAQLPDRFKFAPEMESYVDSFLEGCPDPEKQFAVMVAFSSLTNQGYPVVPSYWKVVRHLQLPVLLRYVDWLKDMFSNPQLDTCMDFSTKRQQQNQEKGDRTQHCVFRLRKWIVPRLISIVDNPLVKKEEDLVMDIARFIFFHAFFKVVKSNPVIPETESSLAVPLDEQTRSVIANSFFGLLQHLNHLPLMGDSPEVAALNERHVQGVTADGTLWIFCIVQYASVLLSQSKHVQAARPFSKEQREAWDRMLQSVEALHKKAKKSQNMETAAFQQLFLLVGIHLFKTPEESVELINDLQNCLENAQEKKSKKKKATASSEESEEPQWVEVMVEILLTLLSQPSRLMRQVSKTVFGRMCPHVTQRALQIILDVLDPEKDEEESGVVVTDQKDSRKQKKEKKPADNEEEEGEGSDSSEEDSDSSDDEEVGGGEEDEDDEEKEKVNENFRLELMKVLQGKNALDTEGAESDEEELDDDTMMELDQNISALFSEQKKRIQAKKDEKENMRKEKALVRDFKIKVLDLIEVFLSKQAESPLVFGIIEPLLGIIEGSMGSESSQQEQDFLRKTADIFRNQLCKTKRYCRNVSDRKDELHELMERLLTRAQKQADSSVSLYYFSAALYLVRVLKGNASDTPAATPAGKSKKQKKVEAETSPTDQSMCVGSLDKERVVALFQAALTDFMTRRKSSLSGAMFIDLFIRFPILCVQLLESAVRYITEGVRQHQQGQACALVQKALQMREVRQSMTDTEWTELIGRAVGQVTECLKTVTGFKVKVDQEKVIQCLELTRFLIRTAQQQKLAVSVTELGPVLESLSQLEGFRKSGHVDDTYWNVMKLLGFSKPKKEKVKKPAAEEQQTAPKKKKKGFLPETKKRKNRKKVLVEEGKPSEPGQGADWEGKQGKNNKNKNKRKQAEAGMGESNWPAKKGKFQSGNKPKNKKGKQQRGGAE